MGVFVVLSCYLIAFVYDLLCKFRIGRIADLVLLNGRIRKLLLLFRIFAV